MAQANEQTFEHKVLADGAFYVESIERNLSRRRLHFALVSNPDFPVVVRTLTFTEIENFHEDWDEEEDPNCLEQIIGIHRQVQGNGFNYDVRLDQSEMFFYSEAEPFVKEVGTVAA